MAKRSSAACGDQRTSILLTEDPIETLADLSVGEIFAPVELFEALFYLRSEPCVVVDVAFHKLLDIAVRIWKTSGQ